MPSDPRISTHDWSLVQRAGKGVAVGRAFAFVFPSAFAHPELAWVRSTFGQKTVEAPRIFSLLGPEAVALPGVTIRPLDLPALSLAHVTCDKELYREGRDSVHLLALDPLAPHSGATLVLSLDGVEFAKHYVWLNASGAATIALRDLPPGGFAVSFAGAPDDAPACEFTVAEYRLAPLVASLVDRRLEGAARRLWVRLRVESYGIPVEGGVRVELSEQGRPRGCVMATTTNGLVEATFTLDGDGPFSINLALASDPSRTATVPIPGSRAAERSSTVFSTLGDEVDGSLLPSPGSRPVRGLFLDDGKRLTTPFRLERVDTRRIRLSASVAAGPVAVAVVDPSFPAPRPGALDPTRARHPALDDETYRRAEGLFNEGRYPEALEQFERGRTAQSNPHPFYAYYMACCNARCGAREAAVTALRTAIEDGWSDFAHLSVDEDLARLRGMARYESLAAGGRRVTTFDAIEPGAVIEVDAPEPTALVAIGAVVDGSAWEGWAATVAPSTLSPRIVVPAIVEPSRDLTVLVETGGASASASVYLVVKDARLLAGDTPASRFGARIKAYVDGASKRLAVGTPDWLADLVEPPYFPAPSASVNRASVDFDGTTLSGNRPPMPSYPSAMPPPMPMQQAMPAAMPASTYATAGVAKTVEMALTASMDPGPAATPTGPLVTQRLGVEPHEVLFAGLVPVVDGRAQTTVRIAASFANYVVEAIVLDGLDWAPAEARFQAAKDPFVAFELPAFVHPDDVAVGRVALGASGGQLSVRVTRDGSEIPLVFDGRPVASGETILATRGEATFLATPGFYEVRVDDLARRATDTDMRRVDEPGRLRRMARAVRMLEPGEHVSRDSDASIVALRVLPSLDGPFELLVEATADYGHACCEQTAAKILSACAMYAFAGSNETRRLDAEAIVVAGVRREQSMWLRGRGFKMYPESANTPHDYYGPKAARYLWNLVLLRATGVSRTLALAIDQGLEMASDACRAYGIAWPPSSATTCEEAYSMALFGADRSREKAASVARAYASGTLPPPQSGYGHGAVATRAEAAYASATLLRAGGPGDRRAAIGLANHVIGAVGETGRLYSTVDSSAAIALVGELRAARVIAADGGVEVDGRRLSGRDAAALGTSIHRAAATDGVVAVEVSRMVEDDWSALSARVPVTISLESDGRPLRHFTVGDSVELRARLDGGYRDGDLLWVCLPDALSRVVGGGQVKRFSIDFGGASEVVVALAATSVTVDRQGGLGSQRFAACVRNMFEEERAGNPGPIEVTVAPPDAAGGSASTFVRMFESLRGLLGDRVRT